MSHESDLAKIDSANTVIELLLNEERYPDDTEKLPELGRAISGLLNWDGMAIMRVFLPH